MRALLLVLCLTLFSCKSDSKPGIDTSQLSLANKAEQVTIIRDDFGIPHIYGKTDADAVSAYCMHNVKMTLIV